MPASDTVPADYQQITTDKEFIISTNVEESAITTPKTEKKKSSLSCQQVVDVYHELIPEAPESGHK
jgi:magnesium-transporting ATPase (P-type)